MQGHTVLSKGLFIKADKLSTLSFKMPANKAHTSKATFKKAIPNTANTLLIAQKYNASEK